MGAAARSTAALMAPADNDSEGQARVGALGERLKELGWIEGSNMRSEYRWFAGDRDRAQAYARELVDTSPSIIVVSSTLGLSAARQATDKIPIVFLLVGDPVGQGFVKSLAHPGGNITGFIPRSSSRSAANGCS
jgi:putative tryptophan/tyrosine transport system substrate-binding protein